MYLKLLREPADGKSVRGVLYQVHFERIGAYGHSEKLTKICDTLENRDYLIPPLIYRVTVTMSPKFKRLLPVLCAVPATSEHPSADGRSPIGHTHSSRFPTGALGGVHPDTGCGDGGVCDGTAGARVQGGRGEDGD